MKSVLTPAGTKEMYIQVKLGGKKPLETLVLAILAAQKMFLKRGDGKEALIALTTAGFLRTYLPLWPDISPSWYTPTRNFFNLSKRVTADISTAVALVEVAYVLGINMEVSVHAFGDSVRIHGGDFQAFVDSPQGYILAARRELKRKVYESLKESFT